MVAPAVSVAAKNVTSAARLVISLVTALRAEASAEATAVVVEVVSADAHRLAIHAVDTAIWLVTAPRGRSATTVFLTDLHLVCLYTPQLIFESGGEVGHVSRDCPTESTDRICYKCRQPGHVQAACPNN